MSKQCEHQGSRRRFLEAASRPYGRDNVSPSICRDTRTRGSGGSGQGKKDDSRTPECEASPKIRASRLTLLRFSTSEILEDDFAWAWYRIQSVELFEVQHDGHGWAKAVETNQNGKKKHVMGDRRRGCMIEWKDRLLVIREGQIHLFKDLSDLILHKPRFLSHLTVIRKSEHLKESAIEATPEIPTLSTKFRTRSSDINRNRDNLFRE
ncbi:uncharacterized protein ARMOST_16149 [Armillaria ostoyae]|uniref:Uncharacterized protein n=1 Tax=Armillaria ostoyae TaxID=47428 RepID=A0A284RVC9_ARMOS|nr:uncharacterized protein ARMOST_16149 [Armillaria ostoyae]